MKLLFCKRCQDVIKLSYETRTCKCGRIGGRYLNDGLNAEYFETERAIAIPLGFSNDSLVDAVLNQPKSGRGEEFTAFVIPKKCPTMKKVKKI